jgi:hypothetical protein
MSIEYEWDDDTRIMKGNNLDPLQYTSVLLMVLKLYSVDSYGHFTK